MKVIDIKCSMGVRLLYPIWEVMYIGAKYICLVFFLLLALKQDLKSYKIPNSIILIGYLLSLLFFHQEYEWTSIYKWLGSIIIPILILFPLFFIKALGAGDIKLFSVIGGFFGTFYAMQIIAISFVVGAVLSLVQLIRYQVLKIRLLYLLSYFRGCRLKTTTQHKQESKFKYYDRERDGTKVVIHFSAAIFIAIIFKLVSIFITKL